MLTEINIIGEHMEYLNSNYIEKSEIIDSWHFQSITTEFLNSLNTSGLPNHVCNSSFFDLVTSKFTQKTIFFKFIKPIYII